MLKLDDGCESRNEVKYLHKQGIGMVARLACFGNELTSLKK